MKKRIFAGLLAFMMMLNVIPATEVSATSLSGANLPTVSGPNLDESNTPAPTADDGEEETQTLTFGQFVEAVIAANGTYDGNNITVEIKPESGQTDDTNAWKIPDRLQKYSNPEVYYAQYQRFKKLTNVNISNVNFKFTPAAVTVKDAWNAAGATTTVDNINGEIQFENTGAVTLTNCNFDMISVSPFNAAALNVDNCVFHNLDAYAIKDVKASSVEIKGTTFNDCNGGFWFSNAPTTLTATGNVFTEVGRRGAIQFSATGDYTNTKMTVEGNQVDGIILWQLNNTVTLNQICNILDPELNTYTTAYVSGSIEVNPVAKIGHNYYATLQEAINSVKDGTSEVTVELLADATIAETDIKCPMTLKGNGHTVTGTGKKMFRNFATATYEDVTIVNETHEGRCIETRSGNMDLYLRNTTLKTTSTGNNQPLTVGGSGKEIYVLLDKSMIDAGVAGYGITTFNPVTINIMEQSEVTGYAALYFKPADGSEGSKGTKVYVYGGSKLSSQNGHSGQLENKNGFATVVFEDNGITFDADSTVSLSAVTNGTPEASQAIFGIKENITGINIYAEAAKVSAKDVLSGSDLSHEHHISLPSGYEDEIECSHSKESVFTGAWDATCTEDGNTGDYVCKYCGEITTPGTVVPATGHDFDKDGVCNNGCGTVLILEEDAKVEVQIQPEYVSGDVSETITSEEEKEIADFVANNIIVENMDAMVESVTAVGSEAAKDEALHAKAEAALSPAENEEVIVIVKPYLQSEIKAVDVDATENKALVSVEMNLVYDVVAKIDKESAEEVTLESGKKVENPKPMDISFAIPGELIDAKALKEAGKVLYIEHPKADGSIYYHEASIEEFEIEEPDGTKRYYDVITFHNDKGFSEFNLMIGDKVPADKVVSTSTPAPAATIAMYAETGEYIEVSSVSESIIEEGKEELRALIGDSYGKYRLALAADLHADLKGSTKIKILVDDVTAADAVIILHKGADGWEAISNKAGDGYVIGKFSSLSPVLVFVDEDGELEAAQTGNITTTTPAGTTAPAATGDSSMTALWIGVLAIAAVAVVCTFVYNKKRRV